MANTFHMNSRCPASCEMSSFNGAFLFLLLFSSFPFSFWLFFFFFLFPLFLFFLFLLHYGTMKIEHLPLWESSSLQRQSMTNAVHYWWSLDTLQELCFHSTISFRGYLTHTKKKKKKIFATVLTLILMMPEGPQEAACSFPGAVQGCSGLTVGYWHVEDVLGWQWFTGPQMSGVGGWSSAEEPSGPYHNAEPWQKKS